MTYSIHNQPKELFHIFGACILEVADFHVSLHPISKSIILFPLHEKDRFKKEAPDFGFVHTIDSCLLDINVTLREIRNKNALPQPKEPISSKKIENQLGSLIVAKLQLTPKGWTTQVQGTKVRKAPLFEYPMQPFLILEIDVKTYVIFARSLINMIKTFRGQIQ
jgi:hypothetical protein